MERFFLINGLIMALFVLLSLYRVILGPAIFNRLIGASVIGTKTLIILAFIGFIYRRIEMFVDISLMYALLNFIVTLAAAKYFQRKGAL